MSLRTLIPTASQHFSQSMWRITGIEIVLHFCDIERRKDIGLLNILILLRTIFSMGQYTLAQNDLSNMISNQNDHPLIRKFKA